MPLAASARREKGAERESAADALGDRHDVGLDPGPLAGEELAGAADAGLHLVGDEKQAVLVAERAQRRQERRAGDADAAFALDRLHEDGGRLRTDGGSTASMSPNGTLSKPGALGPKPSMYFWLPPAAMVASVRP